MNRRNLLAALSSSTTLGLAGCAGLLSNNDDSTTSEGTQPSTKELNPQVSAWTEEWLGNSGYRVSVTVQLNGAQQVVVTKGTSSGEVVKRITSDGKYTIAGSNSDYGIVELGEMFQVSRPRESIEINEPVDSFIVGSQEEVSFPVYLRGLRGSTDPNLKDSGTLSRTFDHDTRQGSRLLSLEVPNVLYEYYQDRLRTPNYGSYVSDTYDDQYIQSIVSEFEDFGERQNLNDVDIINEMMGFVQNLEYTLDKVSAGYNEYPRYPLETLVDREGDCEDSSILLASMLDQFGYGSVLLLFEDQQHAAVGVAGESGIEGAYYEQDGQRYYYTETTAPGYGIGQLPPDMEVGNPEVVSINNSGVLVFSYVVNTPSEGGASVEVTMRNVGDGTGSAKTQVAFKDKDQQRVVSAVSDATQLRPNEEHTVTLNLTPPDDQALRAEVGVVMDGTLQDRLRSEFREPVEMGNMG